MYVLFKFKLLIPYICYLQKIFNDKKDSKNNMSNHKILTIDNLSLQNMRRSRINTIIDSQDEEMINEELPDSLLHFTTA
jgi:hypothetical protein